MGVKKFLLDPEEYHIQPKDIDATRVPENAFYDFHFGYHAFRLMQFLQNRNQSWAPFTRHSFEKWCVRHMVLEVCLDRLIDYGRVTFGSSPKYDGGWLVCDEFNNLHITDDFIERYYKELPSASSLAQGTEESGRAMNALKSLRGLE